MKDDEGLIDRLTERNKALQSAEEKISAQAALLNAINDVLRQALTCETEEEVAKTCLAVAEKLTGSRFGFILELNAAGLLDTIAISNPGWAACDIRPSKAKKILMDMPVRGIHAGTVREGRARIVRREEMGSHPDRVGTPKGHPELTSFLGVPLSSGGQVIGMIGLGNREGGYDLSHQEAIESLSVAFVQALKRKRAERERLAMERKLFEAQKMESLGLLAGGIAHDFNNLLMGVLGNADLVILDLPPESPVLPCLKDIRTAAIRLAELTRQLLAYSGRGKFVVGPVNLSKLVEEMAHLLQISISKKAVIRFDLEMDVPSIEADASQIRQIVMNLITNASEAIGDASGIIQLKTRFVSADEQYLTEFLPGRDLVPGSYVCLEVSDTGCGIRPEHRGKIFDPFFSTKFMGRGLGLAAVLGILNGHRAYIKVYSEPERGTSFKILFPVSAHAAADVVEPKAGEEASLPGGTILVVDDEETVLRVAARILQRLGFDVSTARDGREALERLCTDNEVSAVLLDLTMPHMDGIEAFRQIRRLKPDLPVLLSSGYTEQEATSRFAGKGLAGFVQKPYAVRALKETLQGVLKGG